MRLLITGATGFIGRALAPALADTHDVTWLLPERYGSGVPLPEPLAAIRPQVDVVYADLRNFNLTARGVKQAAPETVIHLAAAGVTNPFLNASTAVRQNVGGTLNLLRACFESYGQTKQVIVARTPGEKHLMNVYAASKAAAWQFCAMYARTAGWPIHGAMIYQAYGPGQIETALIPAAIRTAWTGQDFPMTGGNQRKDWVHIADVTAGLMALTGRSLPAGETVELGTGVSTSVLAVAGMIYDLIGRGGQPLPGRLPNRPGEDAIQTAAVVGAREAIGFQSRISLRKGLQQVIEAGTDNSWPGP